jgi:hypothetical protein
LDNQAFLLTAIKSARLSLSQPTSFYAALWTMKFTSSTVATIVSALLIAASRPSAAGLTPFRVSFDALTAASEDALGDATNEALFWEALSTTGMLSVTGLPAAAQQALRTMTLTQHACLLEAPNQQQQTFLDGTVRRTLATQTVPQVVHEGGMQPLEIVTDRSSLSKVCLDFEAASWIVRQATQSAVSAFAKHVAQGLEMKEGTPLLMMTGKEPQAFATFADVVENGDYLEHFHSYQKIHKTSTKKTESTTIDVHTDQGLFLVFTPGRMANGELTKGFFIQTVDGRLQEVDFEAQDDLVFLLGDGVNQYINNKHVGGLSLRAAPHALNLEGWTQAQEARVWYGLMVLPPSNAVHPAHDGITFGQIRQGLVAGAVGTSASSSNNNADTIRYLACSGGATVRDVSAWSSRTTTERWLNEEGDVDPTSCDNATQLYCWHTCQNLTAKVSAASCTSTSRKLACANDNGQIWPGTTHGDYTPQCVALDAIVEPQSSATVVTPAKSPTTTTATAPTKSSKPASSSIKIIFPTVWTALWAISIGLAL